MHLPALVNVTASQVATKPVSASHLQHVRELDGIRGIAALAVFCHHLFFTSVPHPEQGSWFVATICFLTQPGAFGVDLFFVLSGFLITSILLIDRDRPHYYWNFYWKRALRIFPLYIVSLVCLAAFLPATRPYVVLAALFVANFAQVFHVESTGPFWTLAIEEQFYLVWPQFAKRLTADGLRRLALGVAIGCLLLRLLAAALGHHDFRFTFFHCDGLALGAILACQRFGRGSTGDERARRMPTLVLPALGLMMSFSPLLFSSATRVGMAAEALQITGVSLLAYGVVSAAVRHTGSAALALLRSRVLTFFGLISYCLYLSHLYVLRLYDHLFGTVTAADTARIVVRFFVVLVATVVLCVVSRYAIELPAMRLRRFVLRRPAS